MPKFVFSLQKEFFSLVLNEAFIENIVLNTKLTLKIINKICKKV
jgi:hypothetical protein